MTTTSDIQRPVLRYHGGKWRLAPWIISHFPSHRVYVEPFAGGASVLMRKRRSYAEVLNDLCGDVVNVFAVLRDPASASRLVELLRLTPFARDEYNQTGSLDMAEISDPLERARRIILRSFAGFGSAATNAEFATGFRSNSNRSGTTPAHDWANLPEHVLAWTERLQGVVIENRDALRVIEDHDGAETLIYADPPYVQETRNMKRGNAAYQFEMTDEDHERMARALRLVAGMVVVSGYRCELYDDLFSGWRRIDRAAHADGARTRIESLWLNPAASERTPIQPLFDEVG